MRAFALAFVFLACAGCASAPLFDQVSHYVSPPPDPVTQMPALELRIFALIQVERRRIDPAAKPLALDPELADVARERSSDMAAKKYMAHIGPNGDTSASLLMAQDGKFQGLLGENIAAQRFMAASGVDVELFAQRFVAGWLASPAHKDNLAFADYDRTGIGAAVSGDTIYVTQLFSTDLGLGPHIDTAPPPVIVPMPDAKAAKAASESDRQNAHLRGAIAPR